MKKTLILLFLLSISCIISAQVTWQSLDSLILNTEIKDSVKNYYKYVYKAEEKVVKGNFDKAAKIYEKAFTYLEYPLYRDVNNALKCELSGKCDRENILDYIWMKINKSGDKKAVYNDTVLQSLSFWPVIKYMTDTMNPGIDTSVTGYLKSMIDFDQKYRSECSAMRQNKNYEQYMLDSIDIIDSMICDSLISFFNDIGGYSEEIMGNKWSIFYTILNHNGERPEIFCKLFESVAGGKLHASYFINSLSLSEYRFAGGTMVSLSGCHGIYLNDDILILRDITKENEKLYDKYAEKLMADSYEKYVKKMIWQFRQNPKKFYFNYEYVEFLDTAGFNTTLINKELRGIKYNVFYKSKQSKKMLMEEAKKWEKEQDKSEKPVGE